MVSSKVFAMCMACHVYCKLCKENRKLSSNLNELQWSCQFYHLKYNSTGNAFKVNLNNLCEK